MGTLMLKAMSRIDPVGGRIEIDEHLVDPLTDRRDRLGDLHGKFYRTVLETRDKAIRAALIRLGWTPPAEEKVAPDAPTTHETRLRVRANDAASSVIAAEGAARFADSHKERILRALRDDELSSHQVARLSGLTVVQVDRRIVELKRQGQLEVVMVDGTELLRAGYRVWRRVRSPGN